MKTAVGFAVFFILANMTAALAAEGKALPPPEPNHPWEHAETGLRLPAVLAKMTAEQVYHYNEAALGYSLRYSDRKARLRADIYVYPCKGKTTTEDEIKQAISDSASGAVWEIREIQKQGRYKKVEMGDAQYQMFDLIPESAGPSALLSLPMQYTIVEQDGTGDVETEVGSFLGIMYLERHLVKVRITYPWEKDDKDQDNVSARVSDFVNAVRRCVLDPGLRVQALEQIQTYRRDPLSDSGREVAGGILAYAEVTPLIELKIDETITSLGKEAEQEMPKASLDLLRAYIVGAVAEALKKPGETAPDLPQAGAVEVLRVFAAMQKKKPGLSSSHLLELEKAVKAGKAAEWLGTQSDARGK